MKDFGFSALAALVRRYAEVFRAAWVNRAQFDASPRLPHELAFQPAHLELVETPVHPAPRWTIRLIAALAILALVVALFGKLDIVATAKGKLAPNAQVKIIQPALTGVVREIAVKDGQRVAAGQTLLGALQSNDMPRITQIEGAPADRVSEAQRLSDYAITRKPSTVSCDEPIFSPQLGRGTPYI
ncbi:biotin/lipoyl-binding protein [Burkholderia cepacia]|uniref:biotin/lipoyl-binding protein n=1 Tax=Burkholderia cepacia TaxID=292 RepID=UPI00158CEFD0|nr:biotin/lipoyl-binding protein [Burkholderia cepacia]